MSRLLKFFILLPALTLLWGFSNSIGATKTFTDVAGLPDVSGWTIPGIEPIIEAREWVGQEKNKAQTKAQRRALKALRGEVERRYGPEAAALVPRDMPLRKMKKVRPSDLSDLGSLAQALDLPELRDVKVPGAGKPGIGGGGGTVSAGATITNGGPRLFNRARAALPSVAVKGRAPKTGYDRSEFGSEWSDSAGSFPWTRNGCDTRNDVLKRDLVNETFAAGTGECKVLTGVLPYEPYTGAKNVKFIAGGDYAYQFDIEHIVALGNAWQTGAQQWSPEKRAAFANAPVNLIAADPSSNRQKGDADAATWLPSNKSFRCAYVSRQTLIKHEYGLWMTQAEKDAVVRILDGCAR